MKEEGAEEGSKCEKGEGTACAELGEEDGKPLNHEGMRVAIYSGGGEQEVGDRWASAPPSGSGWMGAGDPGFGKPWMGCETVGVFRGSE